jgi:hypothetical protein
MFGEFHGEFQEQMDDLRLRLPLFSQTSISAPIDLRYHKAYGSELRGIIPIDYHVQNHYFIGDAEFRKPVDGF